MTLQKINTSTPDSGLGDPIRTSFEKVNAIIDVVNGVTTPTSKVSSNITATANTTYIVDTSSNTVDVTLPTVASLSPALGTIVRVIDYAGSFATNNLIFKVSDGAKIDRVVGDKVVSTNNQTVELLYVDTTVGWLTI